MILQKKVVLGNSKTLIFTLRMSKSLRGHNVKQVLKTSNSCFYHGCLEVANLIVITCYNWYDWAMFQFSIAMLCYVDITRGSIPSYPINIPIESLENPIESQQKYIKIQWMTRASTVQSMWVFSSPARLASSRIELAAACGFKDLALELRQLSKSVARCGTGAMGPAGPGPAVSGTGRKAVGFENI